MLGTASGHLTGKRISTSCHHEASVGGDVAFQILGGVQGSCTQNLEPPGSQEGRNSRGAQRGAGGAHVGTRTDPELFMEPLHSSYSETAAGEPVPPGWEHHCLRVTNRPFPRAG